MRFIVSSILQLISISQVHCGNLVNRINERLNEIKPDHTLKPLIATSYNISTITTIMQKYDIDRAIVGGWNDHINQYVVHVSGAVVPVEEHNKPSKLLYYRPFHARSECEMILVVECGNSIRKYYKLSNFSNSDHHCPIPQPIYRPVLIEPRQENSPSSLSPILSDHRDNCIDKCHESHKCMEIHPGQFPVMPCNPLNNHHCRTPSHCRCHQDRPREKHNWILPRPFRENLSKPLKCREPVLSRPGKCPSLESDSSSSSVSKCKRPRKDLNCRSSSESNSSDCGPMFPVRRRKIKKECAGITKEYLITSTKFEFKRNGRRRQYDLFVHQNEKIKRKIKVDNNNPNVKITPTILRTPEILHRIYRKARRTLCRSVYLYITAGSEVFILSEGGLYRAIQHRNSYRFISVHRKKVKGLVKKGIYLVEFDSCE